MSSPAFPERPPFNLRARLLSPLAETDYLWLSDGVLEVDDAGHIRSVRAAADAPRAAETAIDLRPLVVMPGLVDTHVHIPQVPAAGLGAGMDLLAWLEVTGAGTDATAVLHYAELPPMKGLER